MKLLVSRALPDSIMEDLRKRFDVTVRDTTQPMDLAECRAALAGYDVILPTLGDAFGADAFTGEIRAKGLANFGVGYNHIDVEAAKAVGLVVTNTPGAVTDATADIAMTLMLMTCRRAGEGERMVRAGDWKGWHPTQLLGQHLSGKTVGIVGMGRIGKAIARRCHFGFGMDVVFFNRSVVDDPGVAGGQLDTLEDVARAADVVVVAVPANPQTHHLIGSGFLAEMKSTAVLVNIARGDIVDEQALIAALQDSRIFGAGLDVYEFEPAVPDALVAMENVTLFPHLGTATLEVRTAMGLMAVDNLTAFFDGLPLPNPV